MTLKFTFPIPPTLNEQINFARTNRYKSASVKADWTALIAGLAVNQSQAAELSLKLPLQRVGLEFTWYYHTTACDPDNLIASQKYIMDGLVNSGILQGDSLKYIESPVIHHFVKCGNKKDKRVELQLFI